MTVTISLTPEIEAKLRDRAEATGKDVSALIREAVEEKLSDVNGDRTGAGILNDQWSSEFKAWMSDVATRLPMYPAGYTADDSRESIYEGRDE